MSQKHNGHKGTRDTKADHRVVLRALGLLQGDECGQIDDIQCGRSLITEGESVDGGPRHAGRTADEVAPYPPLARIQ
jgi:hypothetical protein